MSKKFATRKTMDCLFMALLHNHMQLPDFDVVKMRKHIPDSLLPWYDGNAESELPLESLASVYADFTPMEIVQTAKSLANHSDDTDVVAEFSMLSVVAESCKQS